MGAQKSARQPAGEGGGERLFCVWGGKIYCTDPGTIHSHLQWFRQEGWIGADGGTREEELFFRHALCGRYDPQENTIYFFRESDAPRESSASDSLLDAIEQNLVGLRESLGFSGNCRISVCTEYSCLFGDHPPGQRSPGTVLEMLKRIDKKKRKLEETMR